MSTLKVDSVSAAAGGTAVNLMDGLAKAWGEVSYSGGVPGLGESMGVSSLTDAGTGLISANLTSAFAAATYSTTITGKTAASDAVMGLDYTTNKTVSVAGIRVGYVSTTGGAHTAYDWGCNFALHGDLA